MPTLWEFIKKKNRWLLEYAGILLKSCSLLGKSVTILFTTTKKALAKFHINKDLGRLDELY
ncbi:MAG: hypothetical protein D8M58_07450 [Calditrichaeota bacterium]|nr:MAG: hypothetical protein DWQ03_19040 [Calditrichota bacterium]MBL1205216.1 hypothetical protein [Calditrichota bacterium]